MFTIFIPYYYISGLVFLFHWLFLYFRISSGYRRILRRVPILLATSTRNLRIRNYLLHPRIRWSQCCSNSGQNNWSSYCCNCYDYEKSNYYHSIFHLFLKTLHHDLSLGRINSTSSNLRQPLQQKQSQMESNYFLLF